MIPGQVSVFRGADVVAAIARSACGYLPDFTEMRGFMAMQVDKQTIERNRARADELRAMGISFESKTPTIKLRSPSV